MKHKRMESILITGANDKNWTVKERDEIIERAVEIYLEKRRKITLSTEPPRKVFILESGEASRQEPSMVSSDDESKDSDIFENYIFEDSD